MAGSKIRLWGSETSASENATAAGLNFAEGQLPSTVNNSVRSLMGQLKDTYAWGEHSWVEGSLTVSVASQTTFKQTGDQTSFFMQGRRVRLRGGTATVFATVVSASFTAETTVTIEDATGSLSASMSVVGLSMSVTAAPRRADKLDVSATLSVGGPFIPAGDYTNTVRVTNVSISTSGTVKVFVTTTSPATAAFDGMRLLLSPGAVFGTGGTRINLNGGGEMPILTNSANTTLTNATGRVYLDIYYVGSSIFYALNA